MKNANRKTSRKGTAVGGKRKNGKAKKVYFRAGYQA